MRRYRFLSKEDVYEALNRLRDSFLAAEDGTEVEKIINAILTQDEKLRIGRRVIIAELLKSGLTVEQIVELLKVGNGTVMSVARKLESQEEGFNLLEKRKRKVEKNYQSKSYKNVGGSTKVFRSKIYTGFRRKNVKR